VLFGNNVVLATPEQARDLVERLAEEAQQYVDWVQAPGSFPISRIDITKDFHFEHQADLDAFVESQFLHKLPYNPDIRLVTDTNGSTYLRRGSGESWSSVWYGKAAQLRTLASTPGLAPAEQARLLDLAEGAEHVVRNETRLRRPALRKSALGTVGDISKNTVEELHLHYFRRAGFDREIGGPRKLRRVYDLVSEADRGYFLKVVGMLDMEASGIPYDLDKKTKHTYQAFARKWGLSAADRTGRDGTLRLYYEAGRLVAIDPDQRVAEYGSSTAPLAGQAQPSPLPGVSLAEAKVLATGQQLDLGIVFETGNQRKAPPIPEEDVDRWSQWWQDEGGWAAPLLVGPEDEQPCLLWLDTAL